MKKILLLIVATIFIAIISCTSSMVNTSKNLECGFYNFDDSIKNNIKINSQTNILEFIKKFEVLSFPVIFSKESNSAIFAKLQLYNSNGIDTLFVSDPNYLPLYYGILPDTTHYYALIYLLSGIQGLPALLVTIDKSGKQISEEFLYCGECSASLLIENCSSSVTIYNDLSIHSIDSVTECERDKDLKIIENSIRLVTYHKEGKIDQNGKISFSEKQKTLNN